MKGVGSAPPYPWCRRQGLQGEQRPPAGQGPRQHHPEQVRLVTVTSTKHSGCSTCWALSALISSLGRETVHTGIFTNTGGGDPGLEGSDTGLLGGLLPELAASSSQSGSAELSASSSGKRSLRSSTSVSDTSGEAGTGRGEEHTGAGGEVAASSVTQDWWSTVQFLTYRGSYKKRRSARASQAQHR